MLSADKLMDAICIDAFVCISVGLENRATYQYARKRYFLMFGGDDDTLLIYPNSHTDGRTANAQVIIVTGIHFLSLSTQQFEFFLNLKDYNIDASSLH